MTAPAAAPISSDRTPPRNAPRPENRLVAQPTPNSATPVSAIAVASARAATREHERRQRHRRADRERANENTAAPHRRAELARIQAQLLARQRVQRVVRVGDDARRHRDPRRPCRAARLVDQRQLGGLLVGYFGQLVALGADLVLEHLALRAHDTYSPAAIENAPASRPGDARHQRRCGVRRRPRPPRPGSGSRSTPGHRWRRTRPRAGCRRAMPPGCRRPISSTEVGIACLSSGRAAARVVHPRAVDRHPADLHRREHALHAPRPETPHQRRDHRARACGRVGVAARARAVFASPPPRSPPGLRLAASLSNRARRSRSVSASATTRYRNTDSFSCPQLSQRAHASQLTRSPHCPCASPGIRSIPETLNDRIFTRRLPIPRVSSCAELDRHARILPCRRQSCVRNPRLDWP